MTDCSEFIAFDRRRNGWSTKAGTPHMIAYYYQIDFDCLLVT